MADPETPERRMDGDDRLAALVRAGGRRPEPPREDYEYVRAIAEQRWRQAVRRRQRRQWLFAAAAAVVLAFVVWPVLMSRPHGPAQELAQLARGALEAQTPGDSRWQPMNIGTALVAGVHLRTSADSGAALRLASGAALRIQSSSELALVSGARLELLSGALYLDTGAASSQRVAIETRYGVVRDIGTIFAVESLPETLRVRVRDGRVRLDTQQRSIEGAPGEEVTVTHTGIVERRAISTSGSPWAWAESLAVAPEIDGKPLLQFLEWVARETGRPLRFVEPEGREQAAIVLLHGSVPNVRPMEALELMLAATDFEYALGNDGTILIHWRSN